LIVHPEGLDEIVSRYASGAEAKELRQRLKDPFATRPGWMPRTHPLVLSNGTVLVPLGNENFNVAAMAMSKDGGERWTFSNTIPGWGISQPSVVRLASGKLLAFLRDEGRARRIQQSEPRCYPKRSQGGPKLNRKRG